ncbi:class I SAM-dependent methyltransferase [Sorangium sp. So ce128]|uniref:class I SAM-dependent methyltransferase n=1 Tax=Sorangium sp. So ce128 TaxID=3133281 RepID=UPI003F5FCE8E
MSDDDRTRWDARYREGGGDPGEPSAVLTALDPLLPRRGRALDLAGGAGRHALWLARRGLDVTLADISEVGLGIARTAAAREGLALRTVALDVERDPLPAGPWDLLLIFYFLERRLAACAAELAPGGHLVVVHPTRSNLLRHAHPSARWLLDDGELPALLGDALEVVRYEEGWLEEGHHEARLVARRRGVAAPPR